MRNEWVDKWVREAVGTASNKKPTPTTTTYNVGGVPLSVTGAHVAFMVVPESAPIGDDATEENQ